MKGALIALAVILVCSAAAAISRRVLLPDGWWLDGPMGPVATTGTMPQGIALSPDGSSLAVVESGYNPPALRILTAPALQQQKTVALPGAFGKPLWVDDSHVLVAGANADALLDVNVASASVVAIPTGKGTWPAAAAVSPDRSLVAAADDGTGTVTIAAFPSGTNARSVRVGDHPSDLVFFQ
jgi:DNA-binding beta-propeller fold protein YncE